MFCSINACVPFACSCWYFLIFVCGTLRKIKMTNTDNSYSSNITFKKHSLKDQIFFERYITLGKSVRRNSEWNMRNKKPWPLSFQPNIYLYVLLQYSSQTYFNHLPQHIYWLVAIGEWSWSTTSHSEHSWVRALFTILQWEREHFAKFLRRSVFSEEEWIENRPLNCIP